MGAGGGAAASPSTIQGLCGGGLQPGWPWRSSAGGLASERSLSAYRELQCQGCGTCPIEAVLPWTLHRGLPSLPAHQCGGRYPDQQADAVLQLWAMLVACLDGEKQGLSVGLPDLVLSWM